MDGQPYEIVKPVATYSPWIIDEAFHEAYERIRRFTMVDRFRCYELWSLAHQVAKLEGAVVEVGVRKGGSGCLLALGVRASGTSAPIYLCDTFKGVVKAGERDPRFQGGEYADTSAEAVRALARELELDNVVVVEGIFPDESGDQVPDGPVALCHIDVDVYESGRDVVDWLQDRLIPGGIVVFDDYGFRGCVGITAFVNELKLHDEWLFFHNLNGHGILVRRK